MLPLNYTVARGFQQDREREIAALRVVSQRRYGTKIASAVRHRLSRTRRQDRPRLAVGRPDRARSYCPS
jgi:hypothetical protein